jgi:hypothetical protein
VIDVQIKLTDEEWRRRLFAPGTGAIDRGLSSAARRLADTIVRRFGSNHGGVPSRPGDVPNSQSGNLRASIQSVDATGGTAFVGSSLAYARHLEHGAVVRPRNGRAIVIPLAPSIARQMRNGVRPRSIINALKFDKSRPLAWIKAKRGGVIVMQKRGRKGDMVPLMLLTSRAVIAPRPWAKPGVVAARPAMEQAFIRSARQAVATGSDA